MNIYSNIDLKDVLLLDKKIEILKQEIIFLSSLATKVNAEISDMPGGGTKDPHSLENIWVKALEKKDEYKKLIKEYWELREKIIELILNLENPLSMYILYQRYVMGIGLNEIARRLNKSYRWVQQLHKEAVIEFKKAY